MFKNLGVNDSGSSTSSTGPSGVNTATPSSGFSFGAPQPITGSSPFGINSLFGTFVPGATPAEVSPPPVTTGTSMPTYTVFSQADPSNPSTTLWYQSITAMPTHRTVSSEELRVQAYLQHGDRAGFIPTASFGAFATSPTSLFGMSNTTQLAIGSTSGSGINHTSGTSVFPKPSATGASIGNTNAFGQRGSELSPSTLQCVDDLLRKFLLGEELVDTQFHLFSTKSSSSRQLMKPHAVCANNVVLAETKYFSYLSSSDMKSSDPSLVDFEGDNNIPSKACMDDYGYESDSDLDDCDDDSISIVNPESPEAAPASEVRAETPTKDGRELCEDGFESVGSEIVVKKTEQSSTDEPLSDKKGKARATASNERSKSRTTIRMRSLGIRRVLVKDTAFKTWYTLLSYLHTGKFVFLPLSSTTLDRKCGSSAKFDAPKCSAKSMYRLASKVGLDRLRCTALAFIQWNLTPNNILKEISSSLASKHPELLEMELDMLYTYIASPPVVVNFNALAQRIALNELPHGAAIIAGIYRRLLKQYHPFSLAALAASANPDVRGTETEPEDRAEPDKQGIQSGTQPSGSGEPPASANTAGLSRPKSSIQEASEASEAERRK